MTDDVLLFSLLLLCESEKEKKTEDEMYKLSFIITLACFSFSLQCKKVIARYFRKEADRHRAREREREGVKRKRRDIRFVQHIHVNVYCLYFRIKEKRVCSVVHPSIHLYIHITSNFDIVRSKNNHSEENDNC